MIRCLVVVLTAATIFLSWTANAQDEYFAQLDFDGTASIEVPRNWTFLDKNLRRHLSTGSEATIRLAGIASNSNENIILVAGSAYTSFKTASATLRLSTRRGPALTQADMREAENFSKAELSSILTPAATETEWAMKKIDGVKSTRTIAANLAKNQGLLCMFYEFETDTVDGLQISQTYVCPLGTQTVKLSTSYRKSEANTFRPVIEYVWQSLRVI